MGKDQSFAYADRAAAVIAGPANAVGRIKKTYGGKGLDDREGGALLVTLYDAFPESLDTAEPLWVEIDLLAVPLFVSSFERRGASSAVVLFDDFERPGVAEMLVGKTLYMANANGAEAEDKGTDFDALVGFELTDRNSGRRGTVTAFYDYPGNPLLGVDFDGREVLVPAADGMVEVASVRKRKLEAELPEGLFDL